MTETQMSSPSRSRFPPIAAAPQIRRGSSKSPPQLSSPLQTSFFCTVRERCDYPRYPRARLGKQSRRRKRGLSWIFRWSWLVSFILGSWMSPAPSSVTGVHVAAQAHNGSGNASSSASSLDFIVSGTRNQLDGLTVASAFASPDPADSAAGTANPLNDRQRGTGDAARTPAGFVVVDEHPSIAAIHHGDMIMAVDGESLSPASLEEWIKATTSSIEGSGGVPDPPHHRVAIFPLVDIDWDPHYPGAKLFTSSRRKEPSTQIRPSSSASTSPGAAARSPLPLNTKHGGSSNSSSISGANNGCTASDVGDANTPTICHTASGGANNGGGVSAQRAEFVNAPTGFPLTGFLKVEVVDLAEAEVTFRPGADRRAALMKELEDIALAERVETERVAAQARALLDAARQEREEEARKLEAITMKEQAQRAKVQAEADKASEEKKQEDARIKREEEAAMKAAAKSKQDIFRMRKEGKQFIFSAEYHEVAPMGITFDLANPLAVVSEVVAGGLSHNAGVQIGDHLVAVNDRDTSHMTPSRAIKLLNRADWPRKLSFSTPEAVAVEGEDQPLLLGLGITDPEIARGEYVMQAPKDWGAFSDVRRAVGTALEAATWPCRPLPMALADPPPACQRELKLSASKHEVGEIGSGREPMIVLVKRGVCTFVEKAKNVQAAILYHSPPALSPSLNGKHRDRVAEEDQRETDEAPRHAPASQRQGQRDSSIRSAGDTVVITTSAAVDSGTAKMAPALSAADAAAGRMRGNGSHGGEGSDDGDKSDDDDDGGGGGGGGGHAKGLRLMEGGMVLLNVEDTVADMPAGNLFTDDVNIPVAMISQGNGAGVEALLSWGVEVRATIAPLGSCSLTHAAAEEAAGEVGQQGAVNARKEDDEGGRFLVFSKDAGEAEFDYRQARYGPGVVEGSSLTGEGLVPWGIAVAEPTNGCDDKAYTIRVAGMFVVVERGACSFSMKTLAAQRAGAAGVIIANNADATLRVMADKGDGEKAMIPTVMVSAKAGIYLTEAAGSNRSPILGRFTRESFDAQRD